MGRKEKSRKYKKLIQKKLDEMGLKNKISMSPTGKSRNMFSFKTDAEGKYLLNEKGEPTTEKVTVEEKQALNYYKSTVKGLLKEDPKVIELFLKQ